MQKITFEDLPSTNTPINATNLNAIQNNVERAFKNTTTSSTTDGYCCDYINGREVVLYNSTSGATSATLSDSATNYTYIEILFKETGNQKVYSSGKLLTNSSGFKTTLFYAEFPTSASGNIYLFGTEFEINGTSIRVSSGKYGYAIVNGSNNVNYENRVRLLRVIGYK